MIAFFAAMSRGVSPLCRAYIWYAWHSTCSLVVLFCTVAASSLVGVAVAIRRCQVACLPSSLPVLVVVWITFLLLEERGPYSDQRCWSYVPYGPPGVLHLRSMRTHGPTPLSSACLLLCHLVAVRVGLHAWPMLCYSCRTVTSSSALAGFLLVCSCIRTACRLHVLNSMPHRRSSHEMVRMKKNIPGPVGPGP